MPHETKPAPFVVPWTRGPWRIKQANHVNPGAISWCVAKGLNIVALLPFGDHDETAAYRRLIALAPELADFILNMASDGSPHSDQCGCGVCEHYRWARQLADRLIPRTEAK
jgi:hypothetical protein